MTFTPSAGSAVTASVGYTIDTTAPTLVPGSSTAQGPLYSRTLTFSENINAATIGVSSIAISGPGITGSIQPASVIGSGTTYVVTFTAPLTKGGAYTLALCAVDRRSRGQLARLGRYVDQFQLTPDTTPPVVSAVTPVGGDERQRVEPLRQLSTRRSTQARSRSSEVSISGPAGRDRNRLDHDHRGRRRGLHRYVPHANGGGDLQRQHRRAGRARHLRQRDGRGVSDELHDRPFGSGGGLGEPVGHGERHR